jgi:selenocysteine-specific elongation factor
MEVEGKLFNALIENAVNAGAIAETGTVIHLKEHVVTLSEFQQMAVNRLIEQIEANPTSPPNPKEMSDQIGDDVLQVLLDRGDLIQVNADVIMDAITLSGWQATIENQLENHGTITVAEVRDLFSTSRKYALGVLEYLDSTGITRRVGDQRVLRGTTR